MFILAVLRAVPQGKLVTRQYAAMSGFRGSAKNLASSVPIASIARFFPLLTTSFIDICLGRTNVETTS